jgi:Ca2+-binding RTX toxin-like protein
VLEFYILPVLAVLGILAFVDFGGGDDSDGEETGGGELGESGNSFNYMQFGPEDDLSEGTPANDSMYLGIGDDQATGGAGDDRIFLSDGQDSTVELNEDGSFETTGMEGDDFIRGGDGRDILVDTLGSNTIYGDTGYDRMNSVDDADDLGTADTMYGGFGEDVMFADGGDVISGGGQEDRFNIIATATSAPATITDYEAGEELAIRDADGGYYISERITSELTEDGESTNLMLDGEVVLVLQGVTAFDNAALLNPNAPPIFGERTMDENGATIDDDFDDDIEIDDYASTVFAFGGDDTVGFAEGAATADRDMTIMTGDGADTINSGDGDDVLHGGLGNDEIFTGLGNDEVFGGFGNDEISSLDLGVIDGADIIDGGAGNDMFIADDGDAITGGAGTDSYLIDMNDPEGAAVRINDFDPATETLTGEVALAEGVTPTVTFETSQNDAGDVLGARVLVDDRVVAVLFGVDPAELNATNVSFTNSNI